MMRRELVAGPIPRKLAGVLAFLMLAAALLMPGCDDPLPLTPEEQKIAVGGTTAVCPSSSNDHSAEAKYFATVFGIDGTISGDTEVVFTSTHGEFDESVVRTDPFTGIAEATLRTARVLGGETVTITGTLPSTGLSDTTTLVAPFVPRADIYSILGEVEVGEGTITLNFRVASPCDVSEVEFHITYNAAVMAVAPIRDPDDPAFGEPDIKGAGRLNDTVDDEEIPNNLDILLNVPGELHVRHYRTDDPLSGFSGAGTYNFVTMRFDALAVGDAEILVQLARVAPSSGPPDYDIPLDEVGVTQITVVEIAGTGG